MDFSIFLGKILTLYKISFLMEITGIISIAPLLVQMVRCLIQETINTLIIFKSIKTNLDKFFSKYYFLKGEATYVILEHGYFII